MIEILETRHSVRSFLNTPIPKELRDRLKSEITYINSHEAGLNFQLFFDDPNPFYGFRKSYGMFRNVRNYMAAIIDPTFPDTFERAGYFAEQFVIEALNCGLGSCFVGGTFSRKDLQANIEVYEKVPFVIALGYEDKEHKSIIGNLSSKFAHRKMHDLSYFFEGSSEEYEKMIKEVKYLETALKAVRCSPSALNKQPVRLSIKEVEGNKYIDASVSDIDKYSIELGIAKSNVAMAVKGIWDWGNHGTFYPDSVN